MSTITIIRGDTESLECNFTEGGVAVNLTGATIFFTVKNKTDDKGDDTEAVITKTKSTAEAGDDFVNGKVFINLSSTDTDIEPGEYYRDLQIKSGSNISSCNRGTFKVNPDVTRRTT